jgi:ribosomal protein S18 acetylase RimI-like enzyme
MPAATFSIRRFGEEDRPFFRELVRRLDQGATPAGRDPALVEDYHRRLGEERFDDPQRAEAFVATEPDGAPVGAVVLLPSLDYFTRRPRAYVAVLAVAAGAEGRGVGKALMAYAEEWARARGCDRVDLDVFVTNERAIAFYERLGYRADTQTMVKRL